MKRTLFALLIAAGLTAADGWKVSPTGSTVTWHGSSTLHDFDGTATVTAGAIDLSAGKEAGWVEVSATSMQSGSAGRDKKMHADHLASATHGTIRFALARLERKPDGIIAHGTWTMHGVARTLSMPVVLPDAAAAKPVLTAAFTIDMRRWDIPVPSTALVIRVDPLVKVVVSLALERDDAAAATAVAAPRMLATLSLPDHRGGSQRLDQIARDRLVMYFRLDERVAAKRCDLALDPRLGTQRPLIRVIDGREYKPEDRATVVARIAEGVGADPVTFLLDWDGALARQLALPAAPLLFIGFDTQGRVTGEEACTFDREELTRVLPLLPALDQKPFTGDDLSTAKRKAKDSRR